MEKINLAQLSSKLDKSSDPLNFSLIADYVVKRNGEIRATKPKCVAKDVLQAKAQYVWRMVVFSVSRVRAHQCMPVCADFDLPAYDENGKWSCAIAREQAKVLNELIDLIVDCVPKENWHGINRWGRALGY